MYSDGGSEGLRILGHCFIPETRIHFTTSAPHLPSSVLHLQSGTIACHCLNSHPTGYFLLGGLFEPQIFVVVVRSLIFLKTRFVPCASSPSSLAVAMLASHMVLCLLTSLCAPPPHLLSPKIIISDPKPISAAIFSLPGPVSRCWILNVCLSLDSKNRGKDVFLGAEGEIHRYSVARLTFCK